MGIWKETSKELIQKSFLFNVFKVGFKSEASEKKGVFDILESKDWANIIPVTSDNKAVMVEQFRYGTQELTLEFPAGSVEDGESPIEAAKRELLEETGSHGSEVLETGKCNPNPAFLNNICYHFVAHNVEFKHEQSLDGLEEVSFKLIPLDEIEEMIRAGKITHSLSVTAWYYAKPYLKL